MLFAELLHEIDQLVDALRRHGIVDGGAHTADEAGFVNLKGHRLVGGMAL